MRIAFQNSAVKLTALVMGLTGLSTLAGCNPVPDFVDAGDVGAAFTLGRYATVCRGLEMNDDWTREYSAGKLVAVSDPSASECVCKNAINAETGTWDASILRGIAGSARNDFADCFVPGLDNPATENRDDLIKGLIATSASNVTERFLGLLEDVNENGELRAHILSTLALCETDASKARFLEMLKTDPAAEIRSAIARELICNDSEIAFSTLLEVAKDDESGSVRAAALKTIDRLNAKAAYGTICDAMLKDDDPLVRKTAVELFRGPKKKGAKGKRESECLRKKAFQVEDDTGVRSAVLTALKRSPRQDVADILCNAIPFWVEKYVDNVHPDRMEGTDIIGTQNNRDFVNTPKCLRRAYERRGRYSCKGKQYVSAWAREVGLQVHVPKCDGI
jgi:hypothetical protein